MHISNFKPGETLYPGRFQYKHLDAVKTATVDVTTGHLWWKKTVTRQVFKDGYSWCWGDTGEFTPGQIVESLEIQYESAERRAVVLASIQKDLACV